MWLKFQFLWCNQFFRKETLNIRNWRIIVIQSGNFIATNFEICKVKVRLVNIYRPNSDWPKFFMNLNEILESNEQEYIIVHGGFSISNPSLDAYNCTNILKSWKNRYLTQLGKISILKTLIIQMCNHLFCLF